MSPGKFGAWMLLWTLSASAFASVLTGHLLLMVPVLSFLWILAWQMDRKWYG